MNKRLFYCIALGISLTAPVPAAAQVETAVALVAGSAVSGIINDLKTSISQLIAQTDNSVSARSFQIRSELTFLLSELEFRSLRTADKTFGQLTQQQQTFFESAANLVSQSRELLNEGTSGAEQLLVQTEQLLGQVPFIGREPRVRDVSPLYVQSVPDDSERPIPITISGSYLQNGKSVLKFGDVSCATLSSRESELVFACPGSLFRSPANISYVSGILELEDDSSSWESFKKVFGYYKPRKQYGVNVTAVPSQLGTYNVQASYKITETIEGGRSGQWGFTNDHCTGRTTRQYNFGPQAPGWEIDVNSIKLQIQCERYSPSAAIRNASSSGFQVEASTQNSGRCEKVFGTTVAYDARGCSSGAVSWVERRAESRVARGEMGSGPLFWSVDQVIQLPTDLVGFTVAVNQMDGRQVALGSAESERWFVVDRDAASTNIIIRPRALMEAMK